MKNKRLLVISVDALNAKDLDYIKKLPNFSSMMREGTLVKSIEPTYPSMTYCCHTSIITGTTPDQHGIFHNTIIEAERFTKPNWYWYASAINVPTLFDLAKESGLKTSAILWPVMAGANIDYNVPEIWSNDGVSSFKLFWKNGSKKLLPYVVKHQHLLDGLNQPNVDNFSEAISIDIIRKKKPHFMCIHYTELDSVRHDEGIYNESAYKILDKMDKRIGTIINTLKETGLYDDTTIVVLGDHGGADVTHVISINHIFYEAGLITLSEDKKTIIDWKVIGNTCGGSVQIHLKDPNDTKTKDTVEKLLKTFCEQVDSPIKAFYHAKDLEHQFQLTGKFDYMLEGKDGYIFKNNIFDAPVHKRSELPNIYKGEHGFLPSHEDLRTMFMIKGHNIKQGHTIEQCQLYDEGPTMAKILNVNFPDSIKGQILDVFLT